jgi:hypothetical protein
MYLYLHKNSDIHTRHTSAPPGVPVKGTDLLLSSYPNDLTSCLISARMIMRIAHEKDVISES